MVATRIFVQTNVVMRDVCFGTQLLMTNYLDNGCGKKRSVLSLQLINFWMVSKQVQRLQMLMKSQ